MNLSTTSIALYKTAQVRGQYQIDMETYQLGLCLLRKQKSCCKRNRKDIKSLPALCNSYESFYSIFRTISVFYLWNSILCWIFPHSPASTVLTPNFSSMVPVNPWSSVLPAHGSRQMKLPVLFAQIP